MAVSRQMAARMGHSSWIRRMFEDAALLKKQLGDAAVLDFSLGNPVVAPPAEFLAALREVVAEPRPGAHRYMTNAGFADVRAAVAAAASAEYGVPVTAEHIVMSCGAAGGLNVVLKTLLDPGDEVLALTPYFPEYPFYAENHGGVLRLVETDADFQPDADRVADTITGRTKAILVNTPNNPTGAVYPAATLRRLAEAVGDAAARVGHPIYLVADDIYRDIVYDGPAASVPAAYRNTIVVNSFSKSLGVAGERIGYVMIPPAADAAADLIDACVTATRILGFVNAPALMQRVIARCVGAKVDVAGYRRNRDVLHAALARAGFEAGLPGGAFYLFPRCPGGDDLATATALRAKGMFVVPGTGFGRPGHVRLSYCVPHETCLRAAELLAGGV